MESNNTVTSTLTELCELGYKYGTDKCPQIKHSYTPFYYELLHKRRQSVKKVLELGIGHTRRNIHQPDVVYEQGVKQHLHRGASLYMWQDFFPNAQIYGADIDRKILFSDGRIKTYQCDERKEEDLVGLIEKTGSDIDIFIDDASHHVDDQIFTCLTLLPLLSKDVIYIIEDVGHSKVIYRALSTRGEFDFHVAQIPRKWRGGMLVVIKNKQNGIQ